MQLAGTDRGGAALAPASEAELVELVREAAARGQPLFCEGNGSKRHVGPAAREGTRRVTTRRLAGITHDPADMVVSVLAGTRLADLQTTLGRHGQWLPVDPPYPNATIGGVLATASVGPRRLGYGTLKDALLGVRVVGATGEVTKSGGRVVKNVSGFDLHRLQLGAFGTLGLLLEAHFKVSNRPAARAALVVGCASFAEAAARLLEIAASPLRPVALEALDAGAVAGLRGLSAAVDGVLPATAAAVIGIEGSEEALARHLRDLEPLRAAGALLEGTAAEALWAAFRDAPARTTDAVTVRVGARPHALPEVLARIEGLDVVACSSHVGTGVARLRLAGDELGARVDRLTAALAACHALARDLGGGYAAVEAAPLGVAGRETLPFSLPAGPASALARKLKDAWDPNALLNPGRLQP